MRLPNVRILLCWSSRTQIYGFVENRTFLEQFVSRGYQHTLQFYGSAGPLECIFMTLLKITHFWSNFPIWGYQHNFPIWGYQHNLPTWGYQHNFPIWGYQHIFGALVWYMSFYTIFWIIQLHWLLICMVMIRYKSMGVNARHRAKAEVRFSEL